MGETIAVADFRTGVAVMHGDVRVTILADAPEPWVDPFGRTLRKIWARREDTGTEGWLPFGPGGVFVLAEPVSECKGEGDYDSLCDNCKESRDNERDAV